jgi:ribosomal subunit interface protein
MRLIFKGVKIDNRTEEYIDKRMATVKKMLKGPLEIEVEIDLDKKGKFRVEVMVQDPYALYRAENTTESVEGSLDLSVDQLKNQIRKNKDKRMTLINRGGRSIKKRLSVDKSARF